MIDIHRMESVLDKAFDNELFTLFSKYQEDIIKDTFTAGYNFKLRVKRLNEAHSKALDILRGNTTYSISESEM